MRRGWTDACAVGPQHDARRCSDLAGLVHKALRLRAGRLARLGRVLRAATAVALPLLAVAACGGTSEGSALDTRDTEQFRLITIRTGTELGINFAFVQNITSTPITLLNVTLVGTGNGTAIRPVEMKIAVSNRGAVPRTAYIEDAPVLYDGKGRCDVQELRPVHGYVLRARSFVTIWTVLLGWRPGRYNITGNVITYTQAGARYQQTIRHGYYGRVTRHAPLLRATQDGSRPCLHLTHLLKGTLP